MNIKTEKWNGHAIRFVWHNGEWWAVAKDVAKARYDATYQFGNTTVHVVAPKITEEENQRRLDEIQRVAWVLWEGIAAKEVTAK